MSNEILKFRTMNDPINDDSNQDQNIESLIEQKDEGKDASNVKDYLEGLSQLIKEKVKPDNLTEDNIEKVVTELVEYPPAELPEEQKGFLDSLKKIPGLVRGNLMALVVAAEILAAGVAFAQNDNSSEADNFEGKKPKGRIVKEDDYEVIKQQQEFQPTTIKLGKNSVGIEDDNFGIFIQNNIKRPENLVDLGKMFIEPLTVSVRFSVNKNSWEGKLITGSSQDDPFYFALDVPYEYAEKFNNANPVKQAEMEKEMEIQAKELIDKILPLVYGVSFYKDNAKDEAVSRTTTKIEQVTIDGFASGETDIGLDKDDPRNEQLSKLRSQNAADVLTKVFKDHGIAVDEIRYTGQGEIHLDETERAKLLEEAFKLKIGVNGEIEDDKILDLITRYNDGQIKEAEARQALDDIVGSKRKVAITVESPNRDVVLVLPVYWWLSIPPIVKRYLNRSKGMLYAHFIPHQEQEKELSDQEAVKARHQGQHLLRNRALDPAKRKDYIKGYSSFGDSSTETRDEIVEGADRRRSRTLNSRQKVELGFDENMSPDERVQALAYVVSNYAEMPGRVSNKMRRKDIDLVNVYNNPDTMRRLLQLVTEPLVPNHNRVHRALGIRENIRREEVRMENDDQVQFTMLGGRRHRGGTDTRMAQVQIGGQLFSVNFDRLQMLADEYERRFRA